MPGTRTTVAAACGCLCLLGVLASAPARAQPSLDRQQASVHFDRGLELIQEGAYTEAAIELERALTLSGDEAVLYNLGMAYAAAGRSVEANDTLSRYLASKRDSLPPAEIDIIEEELRRQRSRIGFVRVIVEPADASIVVDGRRLSQSPLPESVPLTIGDHHVEISRPDYESQARVVSIAGEQHVQLQITLLRVRPAPGAAQAARASPSSSTRDDGGRTQLTLAYVLGGAGIAAGVTALAVYLVSDDRYSDWQSEKLALETLKMQAEREPSNAETERELTMRSESNNDLLKSVWQLDMLSAGLAIGGGALLATGTVLFLTASPSDPSQAASVRLGLSGTGAVLNGTF